jgi:Ca2+-binding EF-hand superfamily protein
VIVFNQIDCDHSGAVSMRELYRMLRALPRNKPPPPAGGWPGDEAPKFVGIEEMVKIFAGGGDGDAATDKEITMDQFVLHLSELPGLKAAIEQNVDATTGKLKQYKSLEKTLEECLGAAAALEAKTEKTDEETAQLVELQVRIAKINASIGSSGLAVFRQIDTDGSGKLDRAELLAALKAIPAAAQGPLRPGQVATAAVTEENIGEIIAVLDADGDETIDEDEWVAHLEMLPLLKASIEAAVDPKTGKMYAANAAAEAPPVEAAPPAEAAPAEAAPVEAAPAEAEPAEETPA